MEVGERRFTNFVLMDLRSDRYLKIELKQLSEKRASSESLDSRQYKSKG